MKRICAEVNGPIFYNQTGVSPRFTQEELEELGVAITISPGSTFRASMMAMYDLAIAMRDEGPAGETKFNKKFVDHPMGDFHTFAGFDEVMELEKKFMPEEELGKYEGTVGHRPHAAE